MKFGVILISHGYFAQEALRSAEMIVGVQENVATIALTIDKNIEMLSNELEEVIKDLDTKDGLLILSDILGGSPSNLVAKKILENNKILGICGFNLAMLLDLFIDPAISITQVKDKLSKSYKLGFTCLNDKLSEGGDDDEYTIG